MMDCEEARACKEVGKEMYHWDDIASNVPKEVTEGNKYRGPGLRILMRPTAMNIEDVSVDEAVLRGWLPTMVTPL
jgi:hypothetical protein